MFTEDDLLPISALQHLRFCPRQCALIHIEGQWAENRLTATGRIMHEKVHDGLDDLRAGVRTVRGLSLRSLLLGLAGVADVVEFHPLGPPPEGGGGYDDAADAVPEDGIDWGDPDAIDDVLADPAAEGDVACPALGATGPPAEAPPGADNEAPVGGEPEPAAFDPDPAAAGPTGPEGGVAIPGWPGRWWARPVEYKRGRPKSDECDEVQLCAQALCLEEMLGLHVAEGSLFYGATRRRLVVPLTTDLRRLTAELAGQLHELVRSGRTPAAQPSPKCRSCSLAALCMPKQAAGRDAGERYFRRQLSDALNDGPKELPHEDP